MDSVPARVVDDLLHDSTDVAISLGEVEGTETSGSLVEMGVGFELDKESGSASSAIQIERTMACERLWALMTLPMVRSVNADD